MRKEGRPAKGGRRPPHAVAAEEARRKAAAGAEAPRTHVKCFYAGLQHGAWLAAEALASRASLAAAVSQAFRDDGVACACKAATIVFVGADKQSAEFPAAAAAAGDQQQQQLQGAGSGGSSNGGDGGKWEAAARTAVRVYVR